MTSFIANYAHYCMIIQLTKTRIIGITIQTGLNYVAIAGVYLRLVLKKLINEFGYKIVQKSNKDYRLYVNVYGKQYHFYTCHSSNEFNETLYRLVWSNWNKNL